MGTAPPRKRRGRSWVFCACGDLDRPSVQRGLRYLLDTQNIDGSWDEEEITGTGFPRMFYLKYDMYRQNFPLLALATYVNYRSGHRPSRGILPQQSRRGNWRQAVDLPAGGRK